MKTAPEVLRGRFELNGRQAQSREPNTDSAVCWLRASGASGSNAGSAAGWASPV